MQPTHVAPARFCNRELPMTNPATGQSAEFSAPRRLTKVVPVAINFGISVFPLTASYA